MNFQLSDFNFELPDELVASYPLAERSASRLFCVEGNTGHFAHKQFTDIVSLISPDDLIVFNNTKVIPARLYGKKETGGQVEILVDRIIESHRCLAHIRASKSPRANSLLQVHDVCFKVLGRHDDLYELQCLSEEYLVDVLEKIGNIPIPNYFKRAADESDVSRYQTVYAEHKGSVAAPTAGLHFDENILQALAEKGIQTAFVTLHVGAGTFAPVRENDITKHRMHSEYAHVSEDVCEKVRATKQRGGRVIAVGTTSVRSLETASLSGEIRPFSGITDIFIYPGFQFHCVDAMVTNFHWPQSSLLMLVSAFAGYDHMMRAYQEAIAQKYRFYSYGDAMFLTRQG